jgi:hypothetical protein
MAKYRKHSWRECDTFKDRYIWSSGDKAFKCRRCDTIAWATDNFLRKIARLHIDDHQKYRRRLNAHLNLWVARRIGPSSVDCDMVPVAEIMEN